MRRLAACTSDVCKGYCMFVCTNLTVERSGQRVLEAVDLQMKPGDVLGLIGPNGCGKTTLLEALVGAIPVASGQIVFDGKVLDGSPMHARARQGIRLVPDRNMVFANLSVEEHLGLQSGGMSPPLEFSAFARFRSAQKAGSLSGGEKRILATVSALQSQPRLLLADEFSEGLQPGVVQKMLGQVRELCSKGGMAILVVHSEKFAAEQGISAVTIRQRRVVAVE